MTLQEHSSTSMAVKAVVAEIKRQLSLRFTFLKGMPDFFYDFDKGLSDQFKQYYAKVPEDEKDCAWICLSYSYDTYEDSEVQPRNGLYWWRPVTDRVQRKININCVQLPLLFSVLCNDSKTFNALHNFMQQRFDWSMTVEYIDLLWPEWTPGLYVPVGWYVRPIEPNGKLYMCTTPGTAGSNEPEWTTEVGSMTSDNDCTWTCVEPDKLKVKAGSFVMSNSSIKNPIDEGIAYQLDFGFTLHFVDYDDSGELLGVIDEVVLDLLDQYNPEFRLMQMRVPEQT